jgi:hypothetical protein
MGNYFDNDKWVNYQGNLVKSKVKYGVFNDVFLHCLRWDTELTNVRSQDYLSILGSCDRFTDYVSNTVEYHHPMSLQMKANTEDNPT